MPDRPGRAIRGRSAGTDLSRSPGRERADRRFAWFLVWLYPPRFRRDVGLALADAIEDRIRERRRTGARPIGAWLPALIDTVRNGALEWLSQLRVWPAGFDVRRRDTARQSHEAHPFGATHASTAPVSDPAGRFDAIHPSHPAHRSDATLPVVRRPSMFDALSHDFRYALRLWRRRPGFALVAVVTLALGVGANTAMFSIVNAVLLRPLPYPDSDRLVSIWGRTQQFPRGLLSYGEYLEIRRQSGTLEATGLYLPQSVNLTGVSEPQRLVGIFATGGFFDTLGLKAERGRLFTEEESGPGTVEPVAVITHQLWRQRFNQDPAAVGSTLMLNGKVVTIVGVLQPPFDPDEVPADGYFIGGDLFLPAALWPAPGGLMNAGPVMLGIARAKPGTAPAAITADLQVIGKRLQAADPKAQQGRELAAEPAHEAVVGSSRPALVLLLAAVAAVLLIACVNVSHLLLARAIDRQKEIALRAALGATRSAVTRQLVVEAVMLAIASALAGVVLARWTLAGFAALRPASLAIPARVPIDSMVLLFACGIAVLVAGLCGLAPALKASRADISRALQAGSRRASSGGGWTRDALVVAEMALSVALVAVSALLIQSLLAVQNVPLGFDPANVFTLQFRLPQTKYAKPEDIARFFRVAIAKVRAVPGVESAALVRAVPFSGNGGTIPYALEGRPAPDPASAPQARFHLVTPDYFRTLRIPLLKGRDFTDRDDLDAPLVAVVNETFARRAWPDEDPIGQRITTPQTSGPITVIGVVGDTKHYTATEPASPQLYAAHYQVPLIFSSLVARTSVPPLSITNEVRRAIWAVDKDQPVWSIYSLDTAVARTQGQSRFIALLLGAFAAVALLLAAVGISGVTSYAVSQQTREIGIRLALGASAGRVLREVVGRGARLTAIAVVVGSFGAVAGARLAGTLLFGVQPTDPVALAGAAIVLATVSVAAGYIPARRAARVDPVVALAEE
jgi:putative ABC transport system permease protein